MKDETFAPLIEPPPEEDPYVGTTFALRYKILRKLGEGSQARVYVAQHLIIGRYVAVKMLLPILASDRALVKRFLNEGRAAGTLGHANVVEVLDLGFAPDGCPYLVMELLEGVTLERELARAGRFEVGRAAYVASQIAAGVSLANQRGIVHRDLKPANVFLIDHGGRPDHVKVFDFGVSKVAGPSSTLVATAKGQFLGTPGFMAPEQIDDPSGVDPRADVYGLGAILYTMLSGAAPFAGVEFPRVLRSIAEEKPPGLRELRDDVPPGLVAAVERAMSKAPSERHQTMAELEEELQPFVVESARRKTNPTTLPPPGALSRPPSERAGDEGNAPPAKRTSPVPWVPSKPPPVAMSSAPPPSPSAPDGALDVRSPFIPPPALPRPGKPPTFDARPPLESDAGRPSHASATPAAPPVTQMSISTWPSDTALQDSMRRGRRLRGLAVLLVFLGAGGASWAFLSRSAPTANATDTPGAPAPTAPSADPPESPPPEPNREPVGAAPPPGTTSAPPLAASRLRQPPHTLRHAPPPPPPRHQPTAAPPPPANSASCNPPYYYEGAKKVFKPNCVQ
jgi:serine/threonine-protein kinase